MPYCILKEFCDYIHAEKNSQVVSKAPKISSAKDRQRKLWTKHPDAALDDFYRKCIFQKQQNQLRPVGILSRTGGANLHYSGLVDYLRTSKRNF